MHSCGSCGGGSRGNYLQYAVDVICPQCMRKAEIKVSGSRDNPGRLFYKCVGCGKFIKWAMPEEGEVSSERGIVMERHDCHVLGKIQQELREIKVIVRAIYGRLMVVLIGLIIIIVVIAMK